MRILLFTGKGGVGKTTVAAATAARAAALGHRTLRCPPTRPIRWPTRRRAGRRAAPGRRPALGRADRQPGRSRPTARDPGVRRQPAQLGRASIEAAELSVIPGLDELFSLIDINRYHQAGEYDLLVVDCADRPRPCGCCRCPRRSAGTSTGLPRGGSHVARPLLGRLGNLPPLRPTPRSGPERLYLQPGRSGAAGRARDLDRPAGPEPREDGRRGRRPTPTCRCSATADGGEPAAPRRRHRPLLRQVEGDPGRPLPPSPSRSRPCPS